MIQIKVLRELHLGHHTFYEGDVIVLENEDTIKELNDEYYILIYHGIRYDIHKNDISMI